MLRKYLVSIHKNDLLDAEREEHVQEEDLVAPDKPLLLCLCVQPPRPAILDQLVLKPIVLCHVRDEVLEGRGEVVLEEPELDRVAGVLQDTQHHDPEGWEGVALRGGRVWHTEGWEGVALRGGRVWH